MKKLLVLLMMLGLGSGALAHSNVNITVPENEAVVAEVPETIAMNFVDKIRLIKVEMTHLDHPTVELDLGSQTSFATEFIVPVIGMGAGSYKIEWRGLGIDGHAMTGEFMFTVE